MKYNLFPYQRKTLLNSTLYFLVRTSFVRGQQNTTIVNKSPVETATVKSSLEQGSTDNKGVAVLDKGIISAKSSLEQDSTDLNTENCVVLLKTLHISESSQPCTEVITKHVQPSNGKSTVIPPVKDSSLSGVLVVNLSQPVNAEGVRSSQSAAVPVVSQSKISTVEGTYRPTSPELKQTSALKPSARTRSPEVKDQTVTQSRSPEVKVSVGSIISPQPRRRLPVAPIVITTERPPSSPTCPTSPSVSSRPPQSPINQNLMEVKSNKLPVHSNAINIKSPSSSRPLSPSKWSNASSSKVASATIAVAGVMTSVCSTGEARVKTQSSASGIRTPTTARTNAAVTSKVISSATHNKSCIAGSPVLGSQRPRSPSIERRQDGRRVSSDSTATENSLSLADDNSTTNNTTVGRQRSPSAVTSSMEQRVPSGLKSTLERRLSSSSTGKQSARQRSPSADSSAVEQKVASGLKSMADRRLLSTSTVKPTVRQRSPSADSSAVEQRASIGSENVERRTMTGYGRAPTANRLTSNSATGNVSRTGLSFDNKSSASHNVNLSRTQPHVSSATPRKQAAATGSNVTSKTETTVSLWPPNSQSRRTTPSSLSARSRTGSTMSSTDSSLASGSMELSNTQHSDVSINGPE